jgi:glycosyltransferase involved in cell wall biosynthesis
VIKHEVSRLELIKWYQKASIYWHGTGYRVNPKKEPEKVEHFGITTVEAMAAGNVPVVIGKGGQLEVVGPDLKKWTWLTKRDCVKKTAQVIRNQELRQKLQTQAQQQAEQFGPDEFTAKLNAIFS